MRDPEGQPNRLSQDVLRLLAETDELLWKQIDFEKTDTETVMHKIHLLRAAAELINIRLVEELGGRRGAVRAAGMVEGIISVAFQTFEGVDPHRDHFDKAAMLWRGITGGHPFEDGNKRTGFMTAWYYLQRAGYPDPMSWPTREMIEFGIGVSAHTVRDVDVIADRLRSWWRQE